MATTRTQSGTLQVFPKFRVALSGDAQGGAETLDSLRLSQTWNADGIGDPDFVGWVYGTLTVTAGDILLAHASDPFGTMGDATYSDGLTVAGKKLKALYLYSPATNVANITVARKATNGLTVFLAASDGLTLTPGGVWLWTDPVGSVTGALATGSNDALTLTPSAGTPTLYLLAVYGT